ncbi:MAG: hypothetical protein ACOYM9_02220 [Bradymonadia bacterium]|jgi:hypothetical protein
MAQAPYKRINFFKGFLTTEADWNDAERYHVEKRKLHNRALHAPGIVPGFGDELRVSSRGRGDLSIEVGSGYAIDAQGNDIVLREKQIKTINPTDFKLPQTIYIVLRYSEDFSDFIAYKENLDFQGHRRIEEGSRVEFSIVEPDIQQEVELARVFLEKGARRVSDAADGVNPKPNELDLRYLRWAGVCGSKLSPGILLKLEAAIRHQKTILSHLARVKKILAAQDALHSVITLEMLLKTAYVDHANIWDLLRTVAELEWDVVDEVEGRLPDLSTQKEFGGFRKNVEFMLGLVRERKRTDEQLDNVITYQRKATESLDVLIDKVRPEAIEVKTMEGAVEATDVSAPGNIPGGISYEDLKVRSEEFTATIVVDGKEWRLVDMIDVLDTASEEDHKFQIKQAKDTYRTRQKLRYPDGTLIEDKGIAHEGGYHEFVVKNLTPHQDLVMIRRMDYVHGDFQMEVHVNGERLPRLLECRGDDKRYRWRNWPYTIPAQYINTTSITVKQVMLTADRDVNLFRYWFYQPQPR